MKVLLIGADGQLGSDLLRVLPKKDVIPLTNAKPDLTDREAVSKKIKEVSPDIVINTAAYHNVDACEHDAPEKAFQVNALGAKYVAEACREIGAKVVYISTDYVFDGEKGSPYVEDDPPCPRSVYGVSKLAGEHLVRYNNEKHFIVRTSSLFGVAGCLGKGGGNFIETMIRLAKEKGKVKVVSDQVSSPTNTYFLAEAIATIIKTENYGLYHITNSGECSWYDFAKKIFDLTKIKVELTSTTSAEFKTPAHRPKYSVLKNKKLEDLNKRLPSWEEALKTYLKEKDYIKG